MFRILVFGMIFWVGASAVQGESKDELVPTLYTVPIGFFAEPSEQASRWPSFKPGRGVKIIHDSNSPLFSQVYDVKEWFEAMGVSFPEGSEAIYMPRGSTVFVRNTSKNIELISKHWDFQSFDAPTVIRNELTVVSLQLPKNGLFDGSTKFSDLKKLAGDSWKELSRLEIVSRSGRTATGRRGAGPPSIQEKIADQLPSTAPDLAPDAEGCSALIETIVGPDGWTLESRVSFRFRGPFSTTEPPLDLTFNGETTLWDGYPQVLQIIETGPDRPSYALILRVTLAMPSSWPMHEKLRTSP